MIVIRSILINIGNNYVGKLGFNTKNYWKLGLQAVNVAAFALSYPSCSQLSRLHKLHPVHIKNQYF
ncbi:protein of unknown function [Legionella fallonii LLAP-10]|uniref:Uncharacterized protein n=1 Tax=Legionella fallonii LLAP-10 TaxID=1212491 RepID=A0A098G7J0_9GAMM|nr:protein of unknown function [Legionella fallonii LLAP-10]